MATHVTDITDIVNSTLERYGKDFLVDVATNLQEYTAADILLNKAKKLDGSGGTKYVFPLLTAGDDNAKAVGLFEVDNVDQVDGTTQGEVPWRYLNTGATFDVKQLSVNSGAEKIFDFVKTKEMQMYISWYDLIEQYFWDGPSSSSDTKVPFGLLNYWLDYDATTGFNGGNHTNFSSGPAGIDCSTYSNWQHFTANYAAVTDADLVRKMREAHAKCYFKGIPNKPVKGASEGRPRFGMYTTYDTVRLLEELLDSKNDNVGHELAKYDGDVMFRGTPVKWVPYLENNHATSDPVIGLDWNSFSIAYPKGEWMRTTPYKPAPNQHDSRVRFLDCSMQYILQDRRRNFLIAKSDPLSD